MVCILQSVTCVLNVDYVLLFHLSFICTYLFDSTRMAHNVINVEKDTRITVSFLAIVANILQPQRNWSGWVCWFHLEGPSIRPSVSLPVCDRICSLCVFHHTRRIHVIFTHLMTQLQRVCGVLHFLKKIKIIILGIFLICYFHSFLCPCNVYVKVDFSSAFLLQLIWIFQDG